MPEPSKPERRYWHGIDYLRALFILFVVADNTKLVSYFSPFFTRKTNQLAGIHILDIIQINVIYLAVPGFIIISIFLFFSRTNATHKEDLKRINSLFHLYVFWTGLWILSLDQYPEMPVSEIFLYIIRGGNSHFYFLFSLLLITMIAAFSQHLDRPKTIILAIISLVMVQSFPIINIFDPQYINFVSHWNPLQFIPFVFIGKLIAEWQANPQKKEQAITKIILTLLVVYIIIAKVEWEYLLHENHSLAQITTLPSYARISLTIGAAGLLVFALQSKSPAPKAIKILSDSSLGIYATHMFIYRYIFSFFPTDPIIRFSVTLSLSIILTYFLKKVFRYRLI